MSGPGSELEFKFWRDTVGGQYPIESLVSFAVPSGRRLASEVLCRRLVNKQGWWSQRDVPLGAGVPQKTESGHRSLGLKPRSAQEGFGKPLPWPTFGE